MRRSSMNSESDKPKVDVSEEVARSKKSDRRPKKWQERLLPLMINLLVALTVFFFIATFFQISYLHWSILQYPEIDLDISDTNLIMDNAGTFEDQMASRKLELLARLEAYVVERRYHEASVGLMSSSWIRYLGFITGMILALIGASFILGRLQGTETEIAGKGSGIDFSLKTAAPGIILAVLGALLMFATIIDKDTRNIVDAPTYITCSSGFENITIPTAVPVSLDDLGAPEDQIYIDDNP
jgi:hypothetical protein